MKTIYDLELSLLTPLHIGSGDTLTLGFDYTVHDKKTWIIDTEAFAAHVLDAEDDRFNQLLQQVAPARLLQTDDFTKAPHIFRYVLPGTPHKGEMGVEVKAHIKDVYDQPYIPGSSLKGALRTAIFREAFRDDGQYLQPRDLGNKRPWAAQSLEQELLTTTSNRGRAPNYDVLRALHLADTTPAPTNRLFLAKARVFGHRKTGPPINLECLLADTVLKATMTIDEYLFTDNQAQRKLRFGEQRSWLNNLPGLINDQTQQRLQQEHRFYQQRGQSQAGRFYNQLAGLIEGLPDNRFLLQIGWGGGWDSKTLSYLLPTQTRDNIVDRYNLARNHFVPGETPFPRTRRAIGRGRQEDIQPTMPLGWVLVEMNRRE